MGPDEGDATPPAAGPAQEKQAVREAVWAAMVAAGVARFPGAAGRIPNFEGAEQAAALLAATPEWARAGVLKCNPDLPQLPVRTRALAEGRSVFVAVPRLRGDRPFLHLDPDLLDVPPRRAASIRGAGRHGRPVPVEALGHVDLVVCGAVAVGTDGTRVGKGGGYADLELALAIEAGVVDDDTVVATTVHPLQVVEGTLPQAVHDVCVDIVVTPEDVLRCPRAPRPAGLLWDQLPDERLSAMPVLAARRRAR